MHLWLHVGSHKTGTTSIQATFAKSRDALSLTGLNYPRNYLQKYYSIRDKSAHHYIAQSISSGELKLHIDAIGQHTDVQEVLLSSERFDYVSRANIGLLPEALSPVFSSVSVIIYVREPVSLATSRGQQRLKRGIGTYADVCAHPPFYDYKETIEKWVDLFGKDNVKVRVFAKDMLVGGDVVDDLLHQTGRDASTLELHRKWRNTGISLQAALAISARKRENPEFEPVRDARELLEIPGDPFTLPPDAQERIRRRARPGLLWLREHYGIDFLD
ncbi:hypothetical protein [Acuticoccus kandeliae]|uniref:hypothetical protein n=1 Tax=Acuticoccus kandeliae TaxID=2073160 RepID=UPI0013009176|nr:hypothetical protein [Acuticoccus kandeliae]